MANPSGNIYDQFDVDATPASGPMPEVAATVVDVDPQVEATKAQAASWFDQQAQWDRWTGIMAGFGREVEAYNFPQASEMATNPYDQFDENPAEPYFNATGALGADFQRGLGGAVSAMGAGIEQYSGRGGIGSGLQAFGERQKDAAGPMAGVQSVFDSKSLKDAGEWLGRNIMQGAGSSVPTIAAGVAGAVVPGGVAAGVLTTSHMMGVGQVRQALQEEQRELYAKSEKAARLGAMDLRDQIQAEAGKLDPDTQQQIVLAAGTVIGGLESVTPWLVLVKDTPLKLANDLKSQMVRQIVTRIAAKAGQGALTEGVTEALQTVTEVVAVAKAKGAESALDYLQTLNAKKWRIIDEGLAGAAGGVGFGVLGGVRDSASGLRGGGKAEEPQNPDAVPSAAGIELPQGFQLPPGTVTPDTAGQPAPAVSQDVSREASATPEQAPASPDTAQIEQAVELWRSAQTVEQASETATPIADAAEDGQSQVETLIAALPEEQQAQAAPLLDAVEQASPGLTDQIAAQVAAPVEAAQAIPEATRAQLEQLGIASARSEDEVRQILTAESTRKMEGLQARQREELARVEKVKAYVQGGGRLDRGAYREIARAAGVQESQVPALMQAAATAGVVRSSPKGGYRRALPAPSAQNAQQAVMETARALAPLLPKGTVVKSFADLASLPGAVQADLSDQVGPVRAGEARPVVSNVSGSPIDAFEQEGTIYLAEYALNPEGRISHEAVHALVSAGLVDPKEIAILADRARKTGAFSKTREARYTRDYKERFPTDWQSRIEEEAAAHLIEARANGADHGRKVNAIVDRILEFFDRLRNTLRGRGFRSADDVQAAFFSGEMAQREAVQAWMRANDITAMAQRPMAAMGDVAYNVVASRPSRSDYIAQAMRNLRSTSRTAAGIVDTSASAGKAAKIAVGLTGETAAQAAQGNFESVIGRIHAQLDQLPQTGAQMADWVDQVALAVNDGITKPGALYRTDDSAKYPYTAAADIDIARRQFADELVKRLNDPRANPIETAAWIEWRVNLTDHIYADGVGKTSKALAAIPLMMDGLPLPEYRGNAEFFENASRKRYDPQNGPEIYLDADWRKFRDYYKSLMPITRQTIDVQGFGTPGYESNRSFVIDGRMVRGYEAAEAWIAQKFKSHAGGAVRNERRAVIVLGPPGSGKSISVEPLAGEIGAAVISSDDPKFIMPEFRLGAEVVHEEASALAKRVQAKLLDDGTNLIIEKLGDNPTSILNLVRGLREVDGYEVDVVDVSAPRDALVERIAKRALRTGRDVPTPILDKALAGIGNTLTELDKSGLVRERVSIDNGGTTPYVSRTSPALGADLERALQKSLRQRGLVPRGGQSGGGRLLGEAGLGEGRSQGEAGQGQAFGGAQEGLAPPRQSDSPNLMFALSDRDAGQSMRRDLDASVRGQGQAMFAFAGERARTADLNALARAKEMEAQGKDRTAIWTDTGWFKGVDGKWRFEIDDSVVPPISFVPNRPMQARNFFPQHDVFKAYPEGTVDIFSDPALAVNDAYAASTMSASGRPTIGLSPRLDPDMARSAYLHEIQHQLPQRLEGFAQGGNMYDADYARLAGEVEARTVQKRMDMTPDERRSRPPWEDYDVPEDQQIVRFANGTGVSQMSYGSEPPVPGPAMRGLKMFAIRAYHGSPHDFDRFDMSKIGTGEGAQAYGHGLYFAESEGVAKSYKDKLGGVGGNPNKWKHLDYKKINDLKRDPKMLDEELRLERGYSEMLRKEIAETPYEDTKRLRQRNLDLSLGKIAELESIKDGGRMYEVRINADPGDFLDWDKPLSQQPKVAELVGKDEQGRLMLPNGERAAPDKLRGESFYRAFAESRGGGTQPGSQALADAGIPGIRYLDQGSRTAGEGSRNYVVFRDDLIEIVAKDGKPIETAERQSVIDGMSGKQDAPDTGKMFAMGEDKPVTPGLDMSPEAKKQRAEAMGFDMNRTWYRGGKTDRAELKAVASEVGTPAIWFTSSPKTASEFARIRTEFANFANPSGPTSDYSASVLPAVARGRFKNVEGFFRAPDFERMGKQLEQAKAEGYDGVVFKRINDKPGADGPSLFGSSDVLALFDGVNARSVNAAFDPANANSPNLMFAMGDDTSEVASLQSIVSDLARDLGLTLRQGMRTAAGRAARRAGLGAVFDPTTGIIRAKSVADLSSIAQASGRAVLHRFGQPMEQILAANADDLILPPAPQTAPKPFNATGYSGLDLDDATQARVRAAATSLLRASALNASGQDSTQATVTAEQAMHDLARRVGRPTAIAIIKDVLGAQKALSTTDQTALLILSDAPEIATARDIQARLNGMPYLPQPVRVFILQGKTPQEMKARARAAVVETLDPAELRRILSEYDRAVASPTFSAGDIARIADQLRIDATAIQQQFATSGSGAIGEIRNRISRLIADSEAAAMRPPVVPSLYEASTMLDGPGLARLDAKLAERFSETGTPRAAEATTAPDAETLASAFATWFRDYLVSPTKAEAQAPGLYDQMEGLIDAADPVLLAKLEDSQKAIQAWFQSDPAKAVESMVRDATKAGLWETIGADVERYGMRHALVLRLSSFYTSTIDKTNPFAIAVSEALRIHQRNRGVKLDLTTAENAAKLMRLAPHSHAWAARDMEDGIRNRTSGAHEGPGLIGALVTALGPDRATARDTGPGSRYRQFSSYLVARYAVSEWAKFRDGTKEKAPTAQPPGTATPDEAIAFYAKVRAQLEQIHPAFASAAEQLYDYQANLLKLQRDAGLISPATYDTLIVDHDYVPFYRYFDEQADLSTRALSTGPGGILKTKRGSDRDIIDPIAGIAQKTFETRSLIAANDVKTQLLRLAENAGPGGGVIAERIDAKGLKAVNVDVSAIVKAAAREADIDIADQAQLMDLVQQVLGNDAVATYYTQRVVPPGKQPIVYFFEAGEVQAMQLGDGERGHQIAAQMHEVLNAFGKNHLDKMVEVMALPAHITRLGVTTHPEFAVANIVRDGFMAWLWDPKALPFITQAKGIVDVARGAPYVRQFMATGGMMGGEGTSYADKLRMDRDIAALIERGYKFRLIDSLANFADQFKELFELRNMPDRAVGGIVGGIAGGAIGGPVGAMAGATIGATVGGQAIVKVGEVSETATRARLWKHAYDRAIDSGLDPVAAGQEAAFWAHDYTDYSRRGSKMDGFAKVIPFLNANLQGNDTYLRRLLGKGDQGYNPGILYPLYRFGLMDVTKLSPKEQQDLGLSAWSWAMTVLTLGSLTAAVAALWHDDERLKDIDDRVKASHWLIPWGDGSVIRIPKPFQTVWFAQAIERWITEGSKGNARWFEHYLEDLNNTWKPPMVPAFAEVGATLAGFDINANRQVVPSWMRDQSRDNQYDAYTSDFAKWLGPKLDVAPFYVDHTVTKFGATWGRTALNLNMPGTPWYNAQKPTRGAEEEFIARRFMWKVGRGSEAGQALREMMGSEDPLPKLWGAIAQQSSKYASEASALRKFLEKPIPDHAAAVARIEQMNPNERGYALLEAFFRGRNETKYRMLHPMNRAEKIARETVQLEKMLIGGELLSGRKGKDQKEVSLPPGEKAAARDMLTQLRMMESHNALVLMNEPGWAGREMFKTGNLLAEIKAASPATHKELMRRYETAGVVTDAGLRRTWPEVKARLEDPRWIERVRKTQINGASAMFAASWVKASSARDSAGVPAR